MKLIPGDKWLPKILTTLLIINGFSVCFSQYSYTGRVIDIVTGTPVSGVIISHSQLQGSVVTDNNGAFVLGVGAHLSENPYRILYNIFYSPIEKNVTLAVFNLNGQKIFETPALGFGGTYLFQPLPRGIYLLRIGSLNRAETFKIFSNGESVILLDQEKEFKSKSLTSFHDTLSFYKEGYFQREVLVPAKDTTLYVEMLSKKTNDPDYLNGLVDYNAFSLLKGSPFVTNQSEVEEVKFIFDKNKRLVYFMNSVKYELHFYFAEQVLNYNKGLLNFNMTQYTNNSGRYLYLGSINFYKALGKYIIRFYPGDEMDCDMIRQIFDKIKRVSYLDENLWFYPNNPSWENCGNIPIITSDELYEGQNYQALNLSKNYGFLRKISIDEINTEYLGRHDIVLLNGIPNDISVVAGIITTEFQTPLSHINVLSHNRGTPNMALRDGWSNQGLESLLGQLVYLEVLSDSFIIRKTGIEEATSFWEHNEPNEIINLEKDISVNGLVSLQNAGFNSTKIIGGKAANFAELLKIQNPSIPVPEGAFAIPFYYYDLHINQNNLSGFIENMLADPEFKSNLIFRQEKLNELRKKIVDAPINNSLEELVKQRINNFADFNNYRFRSSTNAEDLEFFSGAGLYDSFTAKKDDPEKTIGNAIKQVWASLWNFRAFEEREYYKINNQSVAMGILVHRSFPDEDANGVLITKNLYNRNPGFIINAQYKEYSIVYPEPRIQHDQIILFLYSLKPGQNFTIEYLSHSNIPELKGHPVLSEEELFELGEYCLQIKEHYFKNVPNNCNCTFDNFGLDIEFKVDSPNGKRKIYIKQVRFYK